MMFRGISITVLAFALAAANPAAAQTTGTGTTTGTATGTTGTAASSSGGEQILTLREAVVLSLQNNLDIELIRSEPQIAVETVEQADAAFEPIATANAIGSHNETERATFFQGGNLSKVTQDVWDMDAGLAGQLPLGLEYSTSYDLSRNKNDDPFQGLKEGWESVWRTEVTLPLLRDLFENQAAINVRRSQIGEDISIEDFAARLADEIQLVENAYWALASRRADVRVQRRSLRTAEQLLDQTNVQYQVGVVSRVDVKEAEAGVAEREFDLIVAEAAAETAQDQLFELVYSPEARIFEERDLVIEEAEFRDYGVDLDLALDKALQQRPEVLASRANVEDVQVQLEFAENQWLPQLDLVSSYSLQGLSGKPADGNQPRIGHWHDSMDHWFHKRAAQSWSAGGRFEIPIGNSAARSTIVQRKIELRRARTDLRKTEQTVILEVRQAVRSLRASIKGYAAADRRRAAAEETLRAENERLRLGDSTPFDVLQREEDVSAAESQLIGALETNANAITDLERDQGSILRTRNIDVQQEIYR
jgi:outer membrane protein TolC